LHRPAACEREQVEMNGGGPWYGSNSGSYSGDGGFGGDYASGSYGYGGYGNGYGDSWEGGKGMKGAGKGGGKGATMYTGDYSSGNYGYGSYGDGYGDSWEGDSKFYMQGNRGDTYSHGDGGSGSKDWSCATAPAQKSAMCPGYNDWGNDWDAQDASAQRRMDRKERDVEEELLAEEMEEMERIDQGQRDNDNASEAGSDALPPPATEGEIQEAREIFRKAQEDLKERNRMKELVKGANQSDLQAMINARLAKR